MPSSIKRNLEQIGWSVRGLAVRLGTNPTRVERWARGEYPAPAGLEEWLARLASAHQRNPMPVFKLPGRNNDNDE